jgi:hypothetical protein
MERRLNRRRRSGSTILELAQIDAGSADAEREASFRNGTCIFGS